MSLLELSYFLFNFYRWWQVPYFWAGIKMYDLVSGGQILKASYFMNKSRSLELFPHLLKDKLKGTLVYYDGECSYPLWRLQRDLKLVLSHKLFGHS